MSARPAHAGDVIVAIATPPGRGGIGIVRVSGPDLAGLMHGVVGRVDPVPGRVLHIPFLDDDGSALDEGIAIYFAAPHSYTGEHVLELHGHGGPAVLGSLVTRCVALGARLAEPGEFTKRAFLNDKLDLAQAEAVADLIDADTRATAKAALRSLTGEFSRDIQKLVDALIRLRMLIEASLDFPDEDIDFVHAADARGQLDLLVDGVAEILHRARQGQLLREGLHVVLIGQPNVGKSSLLNRLARDDIAIVTPVPGTTRDTVRQQIEIGGLAVHLTDTAGVRDLDEADEVERLGIARTWSAARRADCALVVVDQTGLGLSGEDLAIVAGLPADLKRVIVHNKIDLSGESARIEAPGGGRRVEAHAGMRTDAHAGMRTDAGGDCTHVFISAKTGAGLPLLEQAVLDLIGWHPAMPDQFLARERHIVALKSASAHLSAAVPMLGHGVPPLELVAEELRLAQDALSAITGAFTPDDLLGEIFARFCIGK